LILVCAITVVLTGCSMEGVHHVSVVDEDRKELNDIVVLPLYHASCGIGIGADGHGPWSSPKVFTKPFRFSSGEDLLSKQAQGRGIIIPPCIFIGTSKYVDNWLLIKKGYAPLVATPQMVYGGSPIVMLHATNEDSRKCIDLLLSTDPDQDALKQMFHAEDSEGSIQVEIGSTGAALLKANR